MFKLFNFSSLFKFTLAFPVTLPNKILIFTPSFLLDTSEGLIYNRRNKCGEFCFNNFLLFHLNLKLFDRHLGYFVIGLFVSALKKRRF